MDAPPRVFISYARSDGEAFASNLRGRLQTDHPHLTLWQDRAELEGGVGWWKQISEALDQVEILIMVMTPAVTLSKVAGGAVEPGSARRLITVMTLLHSGHPVP